MISRRLLSFAIGVAALVAAAAPTPSSAQQPLRIGMGNGLAFLPIYVATDLKLFEKHGKAAGLPLKPVFRRMSNSAAMQEALLAGHVDVAPFGVSAFLLTRDKTRDTPQEAVVVSGLTTMPLVLVSNRADLKSLADFKPKDRIAMPLLSAPQMYVLRMQAEKIFGAGQADKLRGQVVALPHAEAVEALEDGKNGLAAYFASPPFSQAALKQRNIHKMLTSADVVGGKVSFMVLAMTKKNLQAQPKLAPVIVKALEEAADLMRKDPRRAALIFLKFEPSRSLDIRTLEAILQELKDDFGNEVHGIAAYANFMKRHRSLKELPKSWKDVVIPQLAAMPGS
jgi:NitT/TauT family transport system substrate-binding protein